MVHTHTVGSTKPGFINLSFLSRSTVIQDLPGKRILSSSRTTRGPWFHQDEKSSYPIGGCVNQMFSASWSPLNSLIRYKKMYQHGFSQRGISSPGEWRRETLPVWAGVWRHSSSFSPRIAGPVFLNGFGPQQSFYLPEGDRFSSKNGLRIPRIRTEAEQSWETMLTSNMRHGKGKWSRLVKEQMYLLASNLSNVSCHGVQRRSHLSCVESRIPRDGWVISRNMVV